MSASNFKNGRAACALAALPVLAAMLSGCASVSDTISPAFVDPARYDLYDCKQLATERKAIATRIAESERLMAKAETGVGGALVAEMAYRNDYISAVGQKKLLEETWRRDKCTDADMAAAAPASPAPPPNAPSKPAARAKPGSAAH
jgi:hypothetical protein